MSDLSCHDCPSVYTVPRISTMSRMRIRSRVGSESKMICIVTFKENIRAWVKQLIRYRNTLTMEVELAATPDEDKVTSLMGYMELYTLTHNKVKIPLTSGGVVHDSVDFNAYRIDQDDYLFDPYSLIH